MRIQLEHIAPDENSSFKLLHNPRLNDLFYWHFHPEYELVYIEGASGTRHVGDHISQYTNSDLVFIGSDIPHLNFDYGIITDYKKEVLQIEPSFKNKVFSEIPELSSIYNLFEKSQYGIAFHGATKQKVGKLLMRFYKLPAFEQFLEILNIFQILAKSNEYELLHSKPFINTYSKKEQKRLQTIYTYLDNHYAHKIELKEVATLCNLSKAAFCRYFKKATGQTFISFLNQYRISQAKRLLMVGKNVSEACYDCGFESLSYFNRIFKKVVQMNPSEFRSQYQK